MLSIKDILLILRNKFKSIVISTIVFAAAAILFTYLFIEPIYTSTASLYVLNENSRGSGSISTGQLSASQSLVNTYIMIIKSETTLLQVSADLEKQGYKVTTKQIRENLVVSPITNTEAFYITARNPSPELAQAMTSSAVKIGPAEIIRIVEAGSVKVIDYASRPENAEFPLVKNIVIGILMGMLISVTVILLIAIFDTKVHDEVLLKEVFDLPIIGIIPQYGQTSDNQLVDGTANNNAKEKNLQTDLLRNPIDKSAITISSSKKTNLLHRKKKNKIRNSKKKKDVFSRCNMVLNANTPFSVIEAYKEIRTNVLYLPMKSECKKIAITSSHAKEGKTITSINLAIVMAQMGKKVLLVDADMRASLMGRYLEIEQESGLSEYLLGIDATPNILPASEKTQGIAILMKGNIPPNPAELLLSDRMQLLLEQIEKEYDYIIFDTPPVNVVTDATVLVKWINGYLIVTRAEYSDIEEVKKTVEKMANLGATIYGFILGENTFHRSNYGRYRNEKYSLYNRNMYGELHVEIPEDTVSKEMRE